MSSGKEKLSNRIWKIIPSRGSQIRRWRKYWAPNSAENGRRSFTPCRNPVSSAPLDSLWRHSGVGLWFCSRAQKLFWRKTRAALTKSSLRMVIIGEASVLKGESSGGQVHVHQSSGWTHISYFFQWVKILFSPLINYPEIKLFRHSSQNTKLLKCHLREKGARTETAQHKPGEKTRYFTMCRSSPRSFRARNSLCQPLPSTALPAPTD